MCKYVLTFPKLSIVLRDAFSSFSCNILIQNRSNLELTSKRFLQIICFLNIVITFHSHVMFHFINKKMTFIFPEIKLRYTRFYSCILGRCYHKEIKRTIQICQYKIAFKHDNVWAYWSVKLIQRRSNCCQIKLWWW